MYLHYMVNPHETSGMLAGEIKLLNVHIFRSYLGSLYLVYKYF